MTNATIFYVVARKLHPKTHYALKYMAAISDASYRPEWCKTTV